MEKIIIATISKAQGIKGEVKIAPITDDPERFKKLKQVFVGDVILRIESVKVLVNGVFIKFVGVNDRNMAESLRNMKIEIDRRDAIKPDADRYLIIDIIGSEIVSGGVVLGKLKNILQNGSADVYEVEGDKNFMFPALKDVIIDVNIEEKRISLDPLRLEEVAVYED